MEDERMGQRARCAGAAASYVEAHLEERLDLEAVAAAAAYSKYHLHRLFTDAAGIPLHAYIRRRRLTEAARLLVFSERPIIEVALLCGYESQRAFASAFKAMYKRTPLEFRRRRSFYPLQPVFRPEEAAPWDRAGLPWEITRAGEGDLPAWMDFSARVADGFPCLEEAGHRERSRQILRRRQALFLRQGGRILGAAAFSPQSGSVDFLASRPPCRGQGVEGALLEHLRSRILPGRALSITTFRAGDRADTGQRRTYLDLGFREAELLTEFGYPVQRLILPPDQPGWPDRSDRTGEGGRHD